MCVYAEMLSTFFRVWVFAEVTDICSSSSSESEDDSDAHECLTFGFGAVCFFTNALKAAVLAAWLFRSATMSA